MTLLPQIERLVHMGVTPALSRSDARHVSVTNGFVLAGLLIFLVLGIKNVLIGHPAHLRLGLLEFLVVLLLPIVLALNHRAHHLLAASWAICLTLGLNVTGVYLAGQDTGLQLTLPALVVVPLQTFPTRHSRAALLTACAAAVVTGLTFRFMPDHPALGPPLDPQLKTSVVTSAALTVCVVLITLSMVSRRAMLAAEQTADREFERAERLLLNVLPAEIAARLKHSTETIAARAPAVTVLFADIVGFTPLAQSMPAEQLLGVLDEVFSAFDLIADKHGLEKIKTIGDAYMVAGGVPEPREDHAEAVARMALEMIEAVRDMPLPNAAALELRIGMHTGPVVAGVIGRRKFSYDLWGETVNTASRLESHGTPGRIQVGPATYECLRETFEFEPRGTIQIKGIGEMQTWYLLGPQPARSAG